MTAIAERVLRDIGLTARFARLVLTLGPRLDQHEQPARVGPRLRGVRRRPRRAERPGHRPDPQRPAGSASGWRPRGLAIPDETVFVGGMHNTSSEAVTFADRTGSRSRTGRSSRRPAGPIEEACDRGRPRAAPAVRVGPADRVAPARPGGTSRGGPRTWRRSGRSGATRPTPSASSAGGRGPAGCSSTGGRSSTPTTRRRTTPTGRSWPASCRRRPGLRGHQPGVLLLVRGQHRLRVRDEAAAQHHVAGRA